MVKRIAIIFIVVVAVILLGFSIYQAYTPNFKATVLENNQGHLLVEPAKGSGELKSSDKISFSIVEGVEVIDEQGKVLDWTEIEVGDVIRIDYDGLIMESYPAQIHVERVIRLTKRK